MNAKFLEAIDLLRDNNVTQFEKLIKQFPQLLEIRRRGRSLLTYALLYDRLRALQIISKRSKSSFDGEDCSESALHWIAKFDARKCCKYLLSLPRQYSEIPWIVIKNNRQITPIHLAAHYGHVKILKMLLQSTVLDSENFYQMVNDNVGRSPLHYAACTARLECCEVLLDEKLGLPVDQKDRNGHTPLMCAAASCHPDAPEVVRLLGSRKISSVTARDNVGRTAMHLAIIAQNTTVVDILLNELQCPSETFDNDARTPLHYAAKRGFDEVVKKLLAAKARNATRDCYGISPAHYAVLNGHCNVVDQLMISAGRMEQYDSDGRSCFMWSVIADQELLVQHFLEYYQPNRNHKDKYGYTALHHAAHIGSLRLIKLLVKEGWNIHEVDETGATALHLAAAKGFTNVARLLVMVGANCEHIDQQGRTPIFYACLGGQAHTLSVMVTELNCKIMHTDKLGRTALHCAAFGGYIACIEVLIMKADCLIHKEDFDQFTPIHIACERGKYDCVKYLLKCGAAVNAFARIDDCTPLSCAQANGHQQIVNYLLRNGGLFPYQLRNLAALIIQKWWQQHSRLRQLSNQKTRKREKIKKKKVQ
uniref:BMA-MLT-4 n=1 Tax=Brugia malayi TaxID=6279 RepID=A0A0H5S358_BRUMA|nr:BMA-MLT-4 [Brugia malayi]